MARGSPKKAETSTTLLEAAKRVLCQNGYAGLSTRDVAAAAGVPLSRIHCHFGSKQGMVLALFEHLNAQLLHRQHAVPIDEACAAEQRSITRFTATVRRRWCACAWTIVHSRVYKAQLPYYGSISKDEANQVYDLVYAKLHEGTAGYFRAE